MKRDILPYEPYLKELARNLRQNMTLAEVLLWKRLKGGGVMGYDFDRQRPIDRYIVDFFSKDLMLSVEVDGASHNQKERADAERQQRLEALGVRFVRCWDREVKNDLDGVVWRMEQWIRDHMERDGCA
ncbi:MAG TPA: DUF559 domain-containing protein [Kiritimatiellia bacterium]|nr:DUF559 domain-containing protein [Kiritimatiellia bacterium]HMP34377.1 DUF559 domain-containing protein [Kiritimatiellia bacterium]